MTATTHAMNNGFETWVFTITGDLATCDKINEAGAIVRDAAVTTREEARKMWADAFRLAPMVKGYLAPETCTIYPEYAYVQDEADEPMPFGVA